MVWSKLTSSLDISFLAILIFVLMKPNIWYQNVSIMRNKIFNDLGRAILYIHIPPVNPRMFGLHCSRKKVIPCSSQRLSSWSLCGKTVSVFYTLTELNSKIFLDDQRASKRYIVGPPLYSVQFRS